MHFSESAARIAVRRIAAVKELGALSKKVQSVIAVGEALTMSYEMAGAPAGLCAEKDDMTERLRLWYNEMLTAGRARDIARAATGVGPHLDDIVLSVDGLHLRRFGSQGQQRTGVLALKLSELEFLRSETGEYPILLLDDVMSELDGTRREKLLDFIGREHIQTLLTATDAAYLPEKFMGNIFHVRTGKIFF